MIALFLLMAVSPGLAEDAEPINLIGKAVLPEKTPDWFIGGELDITKATVEIYRDNKEFLFVARTRVEKDGSFSASVDRKGKYYVSVSIPHKDAGKEEFDLMVWAYGDKDLRIKAEDREIDLGTIKLSLQNVLMPGDKAPEWVGKTYDGAKIKLSDFRGKYVLLDFWATWCGPCIAEKPNLKKTYKEFGGDRFEIVALSLDDKVEEAIEFQKRKPSGYTLVHLGAAWENEVATRDYGIEGIPTIMLIAPDGTIIARDLRGKSIYNTVKQVLEKSNQSTE